MPITADQVTIAQYRETEAQVDQVNSATVNASAGVLLVTPVGQNDQEMLYADFTVWLAGTDLVGGATGLNLGAGVVDAANLAANSVNTAAIVDAAITNAKLGAQAVQNGNLDNGAVDSRVIVAAGVGESELATSAVTTIKLADANVTLAKLAPDALTNVAATESPTNVTLASSTGTGDTIEPADAVNAGVMLPDDKTKLNGVEDGANAYVHPDHTGDVTSVADGPTTIAVNAVTTDKLADANVTLAKIEDVFANSMLANTAVTDAPVKAVTYNTLPPGTREANAYVMGWDAAGNLAQFEALVTTTSRKDGIDDIGPVSGSGVTIDFGSGSNDNKEVTLGNSLSLTLSATIDGKYRLRVRQDATGNRVATIVGTTLSPPLATLPLAPEAGALTVFELEFDSTNNTWHW